ncbi:ABC transporter permease [Xylophilus sp.]|uniref:ABC transporter permease n=1 Tax=Xylophilus sp. TaxID=2653893 RepID=UPI0013BD0AAE|nr:ABC transporter permease [Xylophilus sp.]KAF1046222.1 MAG: Teichoic acid translocation permease protein TagG [Xylophilus sp.]
MTQRFLGGPAAIAGSLWRNRALLRASIRREILGRYRGSVLGLLWSFFNPLLMLSVYTFVFSTVFKARWSAGSDSRTEFALVLFAGLIVFNVFSECVARAPTLVIGNANYVKKVVFPIEILPWVNMGAALFHMLISVVVWLLAYAVLIGPPHLTVFWFPLVLLPLVLFVMGVSWFLASLGVYLRDVGQFIGLLITVLTFLSPIFYPVSALPQEFRDVIYLSPLTPIIEQARDVLYWGRLPDAWLYVRTLALSIVCALAGFFWFQRTRKGFADVL